MKFTIIFPSHESCDFAYGLVFIPCPMWVQGNRHIINLNRDRPNYELGSVKRLIEHEEILPWNDEDSAKCVIIVHHTGHASEKCLATLKSDLRNEGFDIDVVHLSSKKLLISEK